MSKAISQVPFATNEPVRAYAPGSDEVNSLIATYKKMWAEKVEVPMIINGKEVKTDHKVEMFSPQDHQHSLGFYYQGDMKTVDEAIETALAAKEKWNALGWEQRASIFLKAADLIAGPYRDKLNAATMIAQSKNVHQAEIDSACEFIDFLRFNVEFMTELYSEQPVSDNGIWNRSEYRPLEGFCFAVTPFNFTAISGNLPTCMAMLGNVVVWKPSDKQIYSAKVIMEVLKEAGLPDGVINMIFTDGKETAEKVLAHPDFAGLHFTGSTKVFQGMWKLIGDNIHNYKSYPRIVGETGGKDFVIAHPSANVEAVATALVRGAFEYQGQKCSAASRAYIPKSIWNDVKAVMEAQLSTVKVGSPEDPSNFVNAVIDKNSFEKCKGYIERANQANDAEVVLGGKTDDSKGWFVHPTVILTTNPKYESMVEEIFGPILTVYVYEDADWAETLKLVDSTSPYSLTGAIFSQCRYAIDEAYKALENAAGNFYINDKPTGAVVGQQPFGGGRASGTNDKAGSKMNLLRWVSARSVKETFVSPKDYKYPYLG
ncbi:L-glutamate gamma-semialdehyde dehydrogenase [Riemerella anatipestifer]|uniref:L-glutamate gamma-semialdehyde dehydrogenase n=1 Tax=Riemerella anatipestifer (strain ATCC 11845 / DSM 15868 / JCM 9532 / NCTC 11014) TaxID=693978 RepID=E4TBN0_RIEAD|nr:L-glutamate gamma-semialdehyde dehydrogenase [Riemerella anatipestifer]ADQ81859.1 delta-1-pyrroline-5-carboxylate dehydrogenase [Riemerella anatipestifer ATCC 11845 = DSM 15868]ADZ12640.1 NAD-dependent aldehyde dehydrogenase [Riemerella anatipestifer RA-GD]AFD55870.1 deltagene-pyrroline-5-carboxylate dehydrogenase [Riemerella anatipestifer ATCC 11845 = DSM 15868]AKP69096.1 1-pyrroline-5-carboxylate dehydrogenase [Riemerella anatipestifer]AKQ39452.1 1-pyrroline-5-carboxylate dehydrogenase [R